MNSSEHYKKAEEYLKNAESELDKFYLFGSGSVTSSEYLRTLSKMDTTVALGNLHIQIAIAQGIGEIIERMNK